MICESCGTNIEEKAKFCPSCGHALTTGTSGSIMPKWFKWLLGVVALVVLAGIFLFLELRRHYDDR